MATWISQWLVHVWRKKQLVLQSFSKNHARQHQPKLASANLQNSLIFPDFLLWNENFVQKSLAQLLTLKIQLCHEPTRPACMTDNVDYVDEEVLKQKNCKNFHAHKKEKFWLFKYLPRISLALPCCYCCCSTILVLIVIIIKVDAQIKRIYCPNSPSV